MAAIRRIGKTWQAQINKQGTRKAASFATKAEAVAWATKIEHELLSTKRGLIPDKPFSDLLDKYADEVSPKKLGARWEKIRLLAIGAMDIGKVMLPELNATHITAWRNKRLKEVAGSTVNREWNLMSNVCSVAVNEWHWLTENPMSKVKRPEPTPPRDKLINDQEIERILFALGYDYADMPDTTMARVGASFLFAIETGMREGEIARLTWNEIDLETRVAKVLKSKNKDKRDVALSSEAIRLLRQLPEHENVFNLTAAQIDSLFRKATKRAMIDDIHYHDARHLAITRLSKKLDVRELARMVGHRDIRMLMIYFNEPASETAKKLG